MLKMYQTALLSFAAAAIVVFSARAETERGTNSCTGFRGVANFDQGLVLTATTNAPAGAKGRAEFIVVNDNGTNYEMLFVKTTGLTNGAYTVNVIDDTGTNTFDLGQLNVATKTNRDDDQCGSPHRLDHGDSGGHGFPSGGGSAPFFSWTNWFHPCTGTNSGWTNIFVHVPCTNLFWFTTNAFCWYTNTLTVGSGSFVLPNGLSQSNAAVINISDTNGVVVLTGDFTSTTNSTVTFKEIASIIPGTATNAQGTATITYRLLNSKAFGTFRLQASGLPPKQKLYLTADATNSITVFTKCKGTLDVRCFPHVNVATIQSVVATDTSSNVVFSVNF